MSFEQLLRDLSLSDVNPAPRTVQIIPEQRIPLNNALESLSRDIARTNQFRTTLLRGLYVENIVKTATEICKITRTGSSSTVERSYEITFEKTVIPLPPLDQRSFEDLTASGRYGTGSGLRTMSCNRRLVCNQRQSVQARQPTQPGNRAEVHRRISSSAFQNSLPASVTIRRTRTVRRQLRVIYGPTSSIVRPSNNETRSY